MSRRPHDQHNRDSLVTDHREFHYRLPRRVGGWRPGAHRGTSLGAGQEFVSHQRLYDRPDPRRLDLRASLRNLRRDWLVRVNRQRSSIQVHAVVDVSASMSFGTERSKLLVAADFVQALGRSAFRLGDALGMAAFDSRPRADLFVPATFGRGVGETMALMLRTCGGGAGHAQGLAAAVEHLAGRHGLVFLVSDFHWPLSGLGAALDLLIHQSIVPIVIWDPAEIEPPPVDGLTVLRDVESGTQRTLWLRSRTRRAWRAAAVERRTELSRFFADRGLRPFFVTGVFEAEALSEYFFEVAS